jgi:predicted nucleic acid-binding Zn ribbon protein
MIRTCVVCGVTGREEGFDVYNDEWCCSENDNEHLCANQLRQWSTIMTMKAREAIYKRMVQRIHEFLDEVAV